MDDPAKTLAAYYRTQALSTETVEGILTAGKRKHLYYTGLPFLACAAVVLLGLFGWRYYSPPSSRADDKIEASVRLFFSQPDFQLDQLSSDPQVLLQWLVAHGGPAEAAIPRSLVGRPAIGCKVLPAAGAQAYIICFNFGASPTSANRSAAPLAAVAPPRVVHLVMMAGTAGVHDEAPVPDRHDGWNYLRWNRRGVSYLLATCDVGLDELMGVANVAFALFPAGSA